MGEVIQVAEKVGGRDHHFKFLQTPYNNTLNEVRELENQLLDGVNVSVLHLLKANNINFIANNETRPSNLKFCFET